MTKRVAVIPFGFGLGDTVNMRPLVRAMVQSRPGSQITVVCPTAYQSLLPNGVEVMGSIRGVPLWQRSSRGTLTARLLQRVTARSAGPVVRQIVSMGWPAKLSAVLYQQGFDEVLNLLEAFNSLRLDDRWTPGPWGSPHEHVIDAMATFLHHRGIEVPAARRKPVLPVLSHHPRAARSIVLNPNAGSSLKEAPVDLWVNLATGLASRGHVPLVLKGQGGGSSESICRHASRARPISTPGLPALTHLLSSADLLISPDTGVLHLAAALGVPYIGLFGSTDPRFLGPYGADPRDILLSRAPHERVCRGCWTAQLLPRANCALGYTPSCLSWLQPRDLLTRIDEKLDATPVGAKP